MSVKTSGVAGKIEGTDRRRVSQIIDSSIGKKSAIRAGALYTAKKVKIGSRAPFFCTVKWQKI